MFRTVIVISILLIVNHHNVKCKVVRNELSDDGPIVETSIGTIKGLRANDGDYDMFMGIPYATVDQSNIFGDSIPQPPFEDVFEAYEDSVLCPQQEEFNLTITGSLDCLHLNIYVPNTGARNLPVMVYIYGGVFLVGSASIFVHGPQYLVRHDVILVTINYRLGPYGFMCLDIPEVPGNAGLKDQLLALKWVQDHIQSFGGDPNQVTVFGNSAGAMSIGFHLMSDHERYFNKMILQSGSSFFLTLSSEPDTTALIRLAESLGLNTNDTYEALSFISEMDIHDVIEASLNMGIGFGPCLEKEFPGLQRFIHTTAINANHTKVKDMPVLLGFTSDEMLTMYPEETGPINWAVWEQSFESTLSNRFNFNDTVLREVAEIVRLFYIGDEDINNNVRGQMLNFSSDTSFVYSTMRAIAPYLEAGAEKVYQYVFSYDGNRNLIKYRENLTQPGAAHADEMSYLFEVEILQEEPSPEDQLIIDRMTLMWTNFAKYSDPTPEINDLLPVKWDAITSGSPYYYLNIDSEMSAERRYAHDRMTFWDLIYKKYAIYERGYINHEEEEPTEPAPGSATTASLNIFLLSCMIFTYFYLQH